MRLQCRQFLLGGIGALAPVHIGDRHVRAAARELLLQQIPAALALDEQYPVARHVRQLRMPQKTLGIEVLRRLNGHAVAGLIQRAHGRRADGGQGQVAPLIEQHGTEPHGVRAREDDEIEILERAQASRQGAPFGQRLDFDGRQKKRARTACREQTAQRHRLVLRSESRERRDRAAGALRQAVRSRCRRSPAPEASTRSASSSPRGLRAGSAAGDRVAQQPRAVGFRNQALERQAIRIDVRVRGDRGLAAAAQAPREGAFRLHGGAGGGVLEHAKNIARPRSEDRHSMPMIP